VTARQALFEHAQLQPGQTIVIHGAAGNVGAFAVQFARHAGLRTIGRASADDARFVREAGADTVIDFRKERFEAVARNADAVIDLVAGEMQTLSFQVLRRGGKLISAVSPPDQQRARSSGVEASFFLVQVTTQTLAEIATLFDQRKLRTQVGTVLPLERAREAHLMLEGERPRKKGKIVLTTATS
jgi:NADPH:quinone reductase-like Zn-dependent oxidoreductase